MRHHERTPRYIVAGRKGPNRAMARVRSLEGREAGILAGIVQGVFRLILGRALNPTKVQAHAPRAMLSSFLSNALLGSGRWAVGQNLVHMVRLRAAARNGCPF